MALCSNGFHTECHCSHQHRIGYYRHDVLALLTKAIASLLHLAIYPSHNPSLSVLPSIYLLKREHSLRVPAGGSLSLIYNCSAAEMFSESSTPSYCCLSSSFFSSGRCLNGSNWIQADMSN